MKKISLIVLPLLFAPLASSCACVYNNGIGQQTDFTIKSVSFNVDKVDIRVGNEKSQLIAVIEAEGEFTDAITLSLKEEGFASLDKSEVKSGEAFFITAVKEGQTTLTATAKGDTSKQASIPVNVSAEGSVTPVAGVSLDKTEATLNVNDTLLLNATVAPENATNQMLTWVSSDPEVASVSDIGLVTALQMGTSNIKVTTVDGGFSAECVISVTQPLVNDGYYLYGTPNSWSANPIYQLERNLASASDKEYMVKFSAKAGDEFKVAQYKGESDPIYFSMHHTESGVTDSIAESIEINYGEYENIHAIRDGEYTLYFDLNVTDGTNYKYWVDVGHKQ